MVYSVHPITKERAIEICKWNYERPYDFYNLNDNEESLYEFLNHPYYLVDNDHNQTIGFFCYGKAAQVPAGEAFGVYTADNVIDIGLGMKPELTGQGKGNEFMQVIFEFLHNQYPNLTPRLTVATFNERAIKLYKKFGFKEYDTFHNGKTQFTVMRKPLKL